MAFDRERFSVTLGSFIARHRVAVLCAIIALTAFFGWQATKITFRNPTTDLFPRSHPYVQTYTQYEDVFGGANVVLIALTVKDGDVFNVKFLEKIRRITKSIEMLPAVNNYQVISLAQRKVKRTAVDDVEGYQSEPVMWPNVPRTQEEIETLKRTIYTTGRLHGGLVSLDDKAALIMAGFFEKGMDSPGDSLEEVIGKIARKEGADTAGRIEAFRSIAKDEPWKLDDTLFGAIEKIVKAEEDGNTKAHMIGRPILLGWIYRNLPQLFKLFLLTVGSMILVLSIYFRDARGVLVPILTAALSAVWGLGFLGLIGEYFNPLVIVVPFIISARALSHSVQLIERYIEEYQVSKDRGVAAVHTFAGLLKPGLLSIVTDAAGVFVVALTPIPLMEKLAVMGGFWILSIIVTDMVFNPVFLSFLPPPGPPKVLSGDFLDRLLGRVGKWCFGRQRIVVFAVTAVVLVAGFILASRVVIGDVHPGSPLLWPGSEYNRNTSMIGEKFHNTEIISVVVEGETRDSIKSPQVLRQMENLQRELEKMPEVSGTNSIADMVPEITKIMHGGDPKWELIPTERRESGFYLEMIFSGAEPGDLARFITNDSKDANISVYLNDHKGETLRKVVGRIKEFIASHPLDGAKFRLAGNFGGLLAAVNEAMVASEARVTFAAFSLTFIFCAVAFRSLLAGFLFLTPILLSNYLTYALMGAAGIGLDVNSLPVVSLGVGLGVDYGLYVVGRMEEEYARIGDLQRAAVVSISTSGRAVLFTASTMVVGILFWAWSFLRFQAEMGILLAFWMTMSMLGGLILLPALILLIKPKFLMKQYRPSTEPAKGREEK